MAWGRGRSRSRRYFSAYPEYVSVAERRAEADVKVRQMEKKGRRLDPIVIEGTKIAKTFWGKAWCTHLEGLAELSNRLGRGRSYVRNGSVIDVQIGAGKVSALVSGSALYTVEIAIPKLSPGRWSELVSRCSGQVQSLVALLGGKLPEVVMQSLCDPATGLFPAHAQFKLSCSCPDGAWVCKHVAAVLYGVGARLDTRPELLFLLRGVDQLDLVDAAAATSIGTGVELEGVSGDLSEIFGIDLAGPDPLPAPKRGKKRNKEARPVRAALSAAPETIAAKELLLAGVSRTLISSWLQRKILLPSGKRGVYLRTAGTSAWLASMKKPQ